MSGSVQKSSEFASSPLPFIFRYKSEALFQAAWLVGSLGILGNPVGFARSIGIGVSLCVCVVLGVC